MNKINNINRREFLEIFGGCGCALMISSCSTAPITERKQLKLLPESTLNRQAAQIYEDVKRKTKLSDDLNQLNETLSADIENNNEFRIKWPRGELGSPPADSEQFMLIEFLSGQVEQIQKDLQNMMNNAVNIERLQKDMDKALADIEELKDKIRSVKNGHTTGE